MWLGWRWGIELSESGGCFGNENILFVKVLLDELFQVLLEGLTVDGLVSIIVMVGAIFFCFRKRGIIPDWSRAPNSRLILDGVKDLVDVESTE